MLALHGNWVDLVILLVLAYFIYQGFVHGFWAILIDFISFFGSLLLSLKAYPLFASFLQNNFSFDRPVGNAIGFLISAVFIEISISFIATLLINKLPQKILKNKAVKVFGVILSFGQGVILVAFLLTLAISLPINPNVKTDISSSKIGGFILSKTSAVENQINNVFGGAINQSLTYMTVEPASHQSIHLDNTTNNLSEDFVSEAKMLVLVNNERTSRGIKALVSDTRLVKLARDYGTFMWENHYFGHYDSEGHDVAYRLQMAGIPYQFAGENLALAPTVEIAHTGLMNSPGHRANILDTDFKKIGIGVIDNLYWGKMFVQEFTN